MCCFAEGSSGLSANSWRLQEAVGHRRSAIRQNGCSLMLLFVFQIPHTHTSSTCLRGQKQTCFFQGVPLIDWSACLSTPGCSSMCYTIAVFLAYQHTCGVGLNTHMCSWMVRVPLNMWQQVTERYTDIQLLDEQ